MKKIIFAAFLFLSLVSGLAVTHQTWAERDVVVTPAPPRTQTARQVQVSSVTTQPAPVATKPAVSPALVVAKTPPPSARPLATQPEHKVIPISAPSPKPVRPEKKETSHPQGSTSFFQGLLDRWFPKR